MEVARQLCDGVFGDFTIVLSSSLVYAEMNERAFRPWVSAFCVTLVRVPHLEDDTLKDRELMSGYTQGLSGLLGLGCPPFVSPSSACPI